MSELAFTLTYPEAPKSLNAGGAGSRRHWSVAHREKQRWQGIYTGLLREQNVPRGMAFCRASAVIQWKQRKVGGRERDSTNYIAAIVKPLADVLAPPDHLFAGKGNARTAIPNPAPRWLADDNDEYFKWDGLRFEYPEPWESLDPRVKSVLLVHLRAEYLASEPPVAQGSQDVL